MTALFWQELVLIILAVVIGMMLGCFLRKYMAQQTADDKRAAKEKLASAATSTAVGAVAAKKFQEVKEKVMATAGAAQMEARAEAEGRGEVFADTQRAAEAEANALAAKTHEQLAEQSAQPPVAPEAPAAPVAPAVAPIVDPALAVDQSVLRDLKVEAVEIIEDEPAPETKAAEEAREAVVDAAALGASDAEMVQLGVDYAAASEVTEELEVTSAEDLQAEAEEAREAVVEAAELGASDAELTQLGSDYAAASEKAESAEDEDEDEGFVVQAAAHGVTSATVTHLTTGFVKESADEDEADAEETGEVAESEIADSSVSEEERVAALLAALPADASDEQKADAVGSKPTLLKTPKGGKADDLKKIKGVGKVLEGKLNDLGVHHFEQVANWTPEEVAWVTTFLSFKGRIEREDWIPQAKGLMGDKVEEASTLAKDPEAAKAPAKKAPAKKAPAKKAPAKAPAKPKPAAKKPAPKKVEVEEDPAEEEARIAAALAALPKDASAEDKANAAGSKPKLLKAARKGKADDLKQIKGVGKVLEGKLNDLGIYHFDQVATWTRKEINWVTTFLSFKGRIERENWIEQAKKLAAGEETEFSKRVAKGEVDSSKG